MNEKYHYKFKLSDKVKVIDDSHEFDFYVYCYDETVSVFWFEKDGEREERTYYWSEFESNTTDGAWIITEECKEE